MKKVLLFLLVIFVSNINMIGQTRSSLRVGIDAGFAAKKYIPFSVYLGNSKMIFEFSFGIPTQTGMTGEDYSNTINWDEYPEDTRSEGEYDVPLCLNYGYRVKNVVIGTGIGYSMHHRYRNKYDSFHILGNNGSYRVAISDGGNFEYKAFCNYYIPSQSFLRFYLKGQYSATMGVGIGLGIEL
ncbi:MAG: hypothetical protein LBQ74_14690 [Prevotella sp.]|jgi:hypothetical protein|nr:hypothetical protein [Prevotella sp.]